MIATKSLADVCAESGGAACDAKLAEIETEVRTAAEKIIEAKKATYYGIGMAMVRITRAIFGNENSVLTVSAMLRGEYGENGIYVGAPCIVNRSGVKRVLTLTLTDEEQQKLHKSCEILRGQVQGLGL